MEHIHDKGTVIDWLRRDLQWTVSTVRPLTRGTRRFLEAEHPLKRFKKAWLGSDETSGGVVISYGLSDR